MNHLTFDQLSELAADAAPHGDTARHLAECATCRATFERLRALVGAAHSLPRTVDPDPDLWIAVRDRIRDDRQGAARPAWRRPWLAVAAVLVIAVMTAVIARGRSQPEPSIASAPRAAAVPALQAVDRNYAGTIADLRATLSTQRAQLAPSTVRTVDRALTVIDSAIAEARAALAADPANGALIDILSAHYERKVDLLQRATELSSL